MKKLLFAGLLGSAALFSTGCANACDKATSTIESKYTECDIEFASGGDDEPECTEARANQEEKKAECIEKGTCAQLRDANYVLSCST